MNFFVTGVAGQLGHDVMNELAKRGYEGVGSDIAPQYSGIKSTNDGTATIQLFDQVDDHKSTSAWYTIDRVTLKGTDDMLNEEVDMSEFAQ